MDTVFGIKKIDESLTVIRHEFLDIQSRLRKSETYNDLSSSSLQKDYAQQLWREVESNKPIWDALDILASNMPSSVNIRDPVMRKYGEFRHGSMGKDHHKELFKQRYLVFSARSLSGLVKKFQKPVAQYVNESTIDQFFGKNPDDTRFILESFKNDEHLVDDEIEIVNVSNQIRFYGAAGPNVQLEHIQRYKNDFEWDYMYTSRIKTTPREITKLLEFFFGFRTGIPTDGNATQEIVAADKLYLERDIITNNSVSDGAMRYNIEYRPISENQRIKMVSEYGCDPKLLEKYSEGMVLLPPLYNEANYSSVLQQAQDAMRLLKTKTRNSKYISKEEYYMLKARILPAIYIDHVIKGGGGVAIETQLLTKDFYKFFEQGISHGEYVARRQQTWNERLEKNHLITVEHELRSILESIYPASYLSAKILK